MAKFFITTNMKNNDKHFQFVFETTEAANVTELIELLDAGETVIGTKRVSATGAAPVAISINNSIIGMVQDFVPRRQTDDASA